MVYNISAMLIPSLGPYLETISICVLFGSATDAKLQTAVSIGLT